MFHFDAALPIEVLDQQVAQWVTKQRLLEGEDVEQVSTHPKVKWEEKELDIGPPSLGVDNEGDEEGGTSTTEERRGRVSLPSLSTSLRDTNRKTRMTSLTQCS